MFYPLSPDLLAPPPLSLSLCQDNGDLDTNSPLPFLLLLTYSLILNPVPLLKGSVQ
jgi:hypothetical protein